MIEWKSIAWRSNNDWIDFYETPQWCVQELLKRESFSWSILEPCSWWWVISRELEEHWYGVTSFDIREDEWVYWQGWVDFLSIEDDSILFDNVVTNPPYNNAQNFIEKSLSVTSSKVAMFLKLQFLESVWRYEFFKNTPLKKIYVFCKRPTLYQANQPEPKNKWTIAYAWYIREHWYEWSPTIDWIL